MSAWIVSEAHIEFLVRALIDHDFIVRGAADHTGFVLWHENHLSIQARYGDAPDTPVFEYREALRHVPAGKLPADWIIKAVGCYDYQTCEHGSYARSQARLLVLALRGCVLEADPDATAAAHRRAYASNADVPWGIEPADLLRLDNRFLQEANAT